MSAISKREAELYVARLRLDLVRECLLDETPATKAHRIERILDEQKDTINSICDNFPDTYRLEIYQTVCDCLNDWLYKENLPEKEHILAAASLLSRQQ